MIFHPMKKKKFSILNHESYCLLTFHVCNGCHTNQSIFKKHESMKHDPLNQNQNLNRFTGIRHFDSKVGRYVTSQI